MKTRLFLLILLLIATISFAEEKKDSTSLTPGIDSLKNELAKAKKDTTALRLLNNLCRELINLREYENARKYATQVITLANKLLSEPPAKDKINYINLCKKGKANVIHQVGNSFRKEANYNEALKNYSRSLKIRKEIGDQTGMAASYNSIGITNEDQGNYAEAIKNHLASLNISEKIGDKKGIAKSLNNLGNIYENQRNYTEALKNHLASLKISEDIGDKKGIASSYSNLGNIYYHQGNHDEGLKNHFASLEILKETGDKPGMAASHNNIGVIYEDWLHYPEALENHLASLKIQQEIGDISGIGTSYYSIGNIYLDQRNYAEALKYFSESLKIQQETGDKKGIAASYNAIGVLRTNQGNYTEALNNYLASLKISEEAGDQIGIADSYFNIGTTNNNQGNYKEALKYFSTSLRIREEFGSQEEIAGSYENVGIMNVHLGNYKEALKNLLAALKIREESGDNTGTSTIYETIGLIYDDQGKYTEALKYYFTSLKIQEKIGDKKDMAASYNNIGIIYDSQGNYTEALKKHSASLLLSEEIGDEHGIANSYNNIGSIKIKQGNIPGALKNHLAALKIRLEIGDEDGIAASYVNIGDINCSQGNHAEAMKNYVAALKIDEKIGDKTSIADCYINIGNVYEAQKNYKEALKNYEVALKIKEEIGDKQGIADSYDNIGSVYYEQGIYPEALKNDLLSLRIGQEIGARPGIIESYNHIGNTFMEQGSYSEALNNYIVSFDSTKSFLSESFNALTENEKNFFKNTIIKNSDHYFSTAYFIKSVIDDSLQWLYNYQLFQRGIVLESSSGLAASVQQDTSLQELWAKFSGYKNIVGKEYLKPVIDRRKDLSALEDSASNAERELLKESTAYHNWKERACSTWQDVQKNLAKDEAAVEFVSFELLRKEKTDSILYAALVVTPQMKYPRFLFLFEEKQLSGLLKNISTSNTSGISNLYTAMRGVKVENTTPGVLQYGDSLYKLIWQPLAPYLINVTIISFVPDGLLNKINMAAIPTPDGKPLCSEFQLRQMASTRNVAFPSEEPKFQPVVFFGGIDYTYKIPTDTTITADSTSFSLLDVISRKRGSEFTFLKGSKDEAESLSNLYKTKKYSYQLIEGKNATEKTFKQLEGKSPAVLHIATHGFFFPSPEKKERHDIGGNSNYSLAEDPLLRSGLALAGGNYAWKNGTNPYEEEDGIVTAYEISHLNLSSTDLVVLSACETGLGDIQKSEGVYGLQRAFKTAGVKYIIMSLWQVPDKETQEFMQTFYSKWLNGKPIRSAFRETQLDMSARYDPYQWAAFVMVE